MPLFGKRYDLLVNENCANSEWTSCATESGCFNGLNNQLQVTCLKNIEQLHQETQDFIFDDARWIRCAQHKHAMLAFILQSSNKTMQIDRKQIKKLVVDLERLFENLHELKASDGFSSYHAFLVETKFHYTLRKDKKCLTILATLKGEKYNEFPDFLSAQILNELVKTKMSVQQQEKFSRLFISQLDFGVTMT